MEIISTKAESLNKDSQPKQTSAAALGIQTSLENANNQVAQTENVQKQLAEQKEIREAIGNIQKAVNTYTDNKVKETRRAAEVAGEAWEEAKKTGNKDEITKTHIEKMDADYKAGQWEYGGEKRRIIDVGTAVFTGVLAGAPAESIATSALSPIVNNKIAKATKDSATANVLAHAVWGAIEAYYANGNPINGAAISASVELLAPEVSKIVYGKEKQDLTPEESETLRALMISAGGIAAGLASSNENASAIINEISVGAKVAENTVTNNYLSDWQKELYEKELAECGNDLGCKIRVEFHWSMLSAGQNIDFTKGMLMSVPNDMIETAEGLRDLALHPVDTLNGLYELISSGNLVETVKQDYLQRIDKMRRDFERAGEEGAYLAGKEFGSLLLEASELLSDTVSSFYGGLGVAKGAPKLGMKFTKLVIKTSKKGSAIATVATAVATKNPVGHAVSEATEIVSKAEKAPNTKPLELVEKVEKQIVHLEKGGKGDWNKALQKGNIEPNTIYKLNNGHTYETDHAGRVVAVNGKLDISQKGDRNTYQQGIAGDVCRQANDCGGHLIASMFNGAGEGINLVPMDKILNGPGGKWYQLEQRWKKELLNGKNVEVNIKPVYGGDSKRPERFEVQSVINGKIEKFDIKNTPTGD